MRIYQGCIEMYGEEKRNLHEMGVRVHPQTMQDKDVSKDAGYETLELSPCVFSILNGDDRDAWLKKLGRNVEWARAEMADRWSALTTKGYKLNPGHAYVHRLEVWSEYLHHGKFSYTYGERFALQDALLHVIRELRERPNTRQAVLPMFSGERDLPNLGGKARIPCTLQYQFLRRLDGLRCFYTMRSSDFHTHFPYDIWLALELQAAIAQQLEIRPGLFTFFTGSLHLYRRDAEEGIF